MRAIEFRQITPDDCTPGMLDNYIRYQESEECWRFIDGQWQLIPCRYRFDWDPDKRRKNAASLLNDILAGDIAFGAFANGELIGYSQLSLKRFGSEDQYVQLKMLQISAPFRGKRIGRRLFEMAANTARSHHIPKLYISANSTKESQAAYRRLGCTYAAEIDPDLAAAEPFDVQMEFIL